MWDHITVLESQYVRLATTGLDLVYCMMEKILMAIWRDLNKYEPLITSISIIKGEDATWRQVCTVFLE